MAPWLWFLIVGVVFFLMMRGGCGAHVMGHGHGGHRDDDGPPPPDPAVRATTATGGRHGHG